MKKTWYNRLLLSYMPVLFLTIGILIFVSISIMSEISIKETEKANGINTKYVIDSMHTSLKGVERIVLEEIGNNTAFYQFFENKDTDNPGMLNYETSRAMLGIMSDNPLIQSIYLYRAKDQTVLTKNMIEKLDNFQDKAFVKAAYGQPDVNRWSAPRLYSDLSLQPPERVISMTKRALLPFGDHGIVVVNVRVADLVRIADETVNSKLSFLDIWGNGQERIYPLEQAGKAGPVSAGAQGKEINRIHSDYIGWDFVSGIKGGNWFGWVPVISHLWIVVGAVTILLSIGYFFYITRRNYKPIETIMQQIQAYQNRSAVKGSDELSYIEKVLGTLIDETTAYEKQYKEDLVVRRRQFFQELVEGGHVITREEWLAMMGRFQMRSDSRDMAAAVIEIDGYSEFLETYSRRDQQLLKFALTNVLNELIGGKHRTAWPEWVGEKRLAVLIMTHTGEEGDVSLLSAELDRFRTWLAVNLKLSVTIGLGGPAEDYPSASQSYREALEALRFKMSLGGGQVILYEELAAEKPGETHPYIGIMDALEKDFRVADSSWESQVDRLAHQLSQDLLRTEDVELLLSYLTRLLKRLVDGLPEESARYGRETVLPAMKNGLTKAETISEILPVLIRSLKQLHRQYLEARESKSNHQLMSDIRTYIEENYENPDLSLNLISDTFSVNGKYFSQLFKEEFGMKFVDFLVNLRMEQAKRLLLETDLSLQEISGKVGYTHPISFGRTFKKMVGVTPGDFRKYMPASSDS
ncbi:helix-turn-helix domain-containing protein [Paenibacillus aurantius]|uniref:Helix-turn-helix domain-containing protein n=1 Tax=Paenibacillus aurantius TaxID=2918900 RepID=A0AA96RHF8_9BACL|nr:helix-turn-helix domain-containing protein [Paenibacillus aurantius]WNQ13318.1 helix-turn-helix domain-containing protein [Paenibacillus aurantius]